MNPAVSDFDLNQHIGELLAVTGRDLAQNRLNLTRDIPATCPAGVATRC
ncbi:hypothetical protein D083_3239 [Dickeya solani RNS 08.23.3.1.A]|nr:hypothetical protein D083_3239 [Dickeya solani RNS 08.23.3.1.A]